MKCTKPNLGLALGLGLTLALLGLLGGNLPVARAVVQVQTTARAVTTDTAGRFVLADLTPGEPVTLTAWAEGYFITAGQATRNCCRTRSR